MKLAILCLCLASTVSAAPSFFHYLPHYGGRQPAPPTQVNNAYQARHPQMPTGVAAPVSIEIMYPHNFAGGAAGGQGPMPSYPSQGFIKYSLPNAPGRKSVEIYYPYDFTQQRMMPNIPNLPQIPNLFPFEYPPQTVPQQTHNVPTFDANPPQSQDPLQPALQDQPTQTSQVPA